MRKIALIVSMVFLCQAMLLAQGGALPSNTFVKTNFHNHDCFANQDAGYIIYNETTRELSVVVDFSKCRVGHDSIDAWLEDIDTNKLVFKGVINTSELLTLSNGNSKTYTVNGRVKYDKVTINKTIDVTFFEISKEGMLYRNNMNDYYDRIRAVVQIEVLPSEIKVNKGPHKLTKPIIINMGSGYVNPFKPGMEEIIGN